VNNALPLHKLFLIDIETVPQQPAYQQLSSEWQTRWWHKIAKTIPEGTLPEDSYLQKAAILAEFGKIVCISMGYFHAKNNENFLKIKSIYSHDEKELLHNFLHISNKMCELKNDFQFAGHNIREFDIPYICRRMIINHIPLPQYLCLHNAKPWEVNMLDTLHWWRFGDIKNYISLDLLASVLGVPTSKTDMDGSMVQEVYYKNNDLSRIVEYCQRDVVVVANVLLRFNNMPLIKEEQIIYG
jgi:predicted PolB exonuclease-like 3'-5' exonuclease